MKENSIPVPENEKETMIQSRFMVEPITKLGATFVAMSTIALQAIDMSLVHNVMEGDIKNTEYRKGVITIS